MKGIYLLANRARHLNHDIVYNDIEEKYVQMFTELLKNELTT